MPSRIGVAVVCALAICLLVLSGAVRVAPSEAPENLAFVGSQMVPPIATKAAFAAKYGELPLSFERNEGQSDSRVRFISRGHGYTMFLTDDEAILKLEQAGGRRPRVANSDEGQRIRSELLRMKLVGSNHASAVAGLDHLPGKSNYFIGNDPAKWRTGVPNFAKVRYQNVYRGVDLIYYGNQGQLEYDFVVAPDVSPASIRLEVADSSAHSNLRLDSSGALFIAGHAGQVRFHKPVIYQISDSGQRQIIDGRYRLWGTSRVGFEIAAYDKAKPLIIDPVLSYASFLGGSGADAVDSVSVAFDSSGNTYVASGTTSTDFPVTSGGVQVGFGGSPAICDQGNLFCGDAFVTKINASGTAIIYSTYLGGSDSDYAFGLAVDGSGNAYVAGLTKSGNFPVTAGAFQPNFGGSPTPCDEFVCGDAFVTKLNSAGSALIYSSYLGGSGNEHPEAIAIDSQGNAYLAGDTGSSNFPTTAGAFQTQLKGNDTCFGRSGANIPCHNAFLSKVNPTGTQLAFSTYLGGTSGDGAGGVVVDGLGRASAVGGTCSADFPVTASAFQRTTAGGCDIFVTTFNVAGSQLLYSTYLGGSGFEDTFSAAIDAAGNIYVGGYTFSGDFPATVGAFQTVLGGSADALVAKVNPHLSGAASLLYATYLGGDQFDIGAGVAVDAGGNAYTCGQTFSDNFPTVNPVQAARNGSSDAFISKLNPQGSALVYSTYLGGSNAELADFIEVDQGGTAYVAGWTMSADFPSTPKSFQPAFAGGNTDVFVLKINPTNAPSVSFTPSSLTFGVQKLGTTSPPQTVIVHDVGSAALLISSITSSGEFAQTNNCGTSVAGGGSCAVSITFTPTGVGTRSGNVAVTDNAAGSPHGIRVMGTGQ